MVEQYNITLKDGFGGAQKRNKKPAKISEKTSWYYFGLVGQIGYSIAVPLTGGVIVGNLIDRKLGTSPQITMLGLGVGMVLSGVSFFHIIQDSLKK